MSPLIILTSSAKLKPERVSSGPLVKPIKTSGLLTAKNRSQTKPILKGGPCRLGKVEIRMQIWVYSLILGRWTFRNKKQVSGFLEDVKDEGDVLCELSSKDFSVHMTIRPD